MKKLYYLIVLALILGLVLTGCLLSNVGQVPTTSQSGITYLTKGGLLSNLVGLWSFDEGSEATTVADSSGNGNTGDISGATPGEAGNFGNALSFDGSGDYVEVSDSASLKPSNVTVECWVKGSTIKSYQYIVAKYYVGDRASYGLYTGSSGGLFFYVSDGGYSLSNDAGTGVWNDEWHHIAGTYDGLTLKLYVDGNEVGTGKPVTKIIGYNTNNLFVGSYGTGYYFTGTIDEVRIWNTALTPGTIEDHAEGIYGFLGLQPPYAAPPKAFKIGSSIPLKWQYTDSSGEVFDSIDANPKVKCQFAGGGNGDGDLISPEDPGSSGLRYNSETKTWQFNWQTKGLITGIGEYNIWIASNLTGQVNGPFLIELR